MNNRTKEVFVWVVGVVLALFALMMIVPEDANAELHSPMQKAAAAVCTTDAIGLSITAWQMAQARLKDLHDKGWHDSWFPERRWLYYDALEAESQRGVDYKMHILACARFENDINILRQLGVRTGGSRHAGSR